VDLRLGSDNWGPIYFCCHDAPVMLLQAATLQQFVSEAFKIYTPPYKSLHPGAAQQTPHTSLPTTHRHARRT
jgi:hypothetical protein